jgi:hypothetical protein
MALSIRTVCGLLLWTVRSVDIDLPQYGVQLEFCDTDCGSYLAHGIGGPFDSPHLIANSWWIIIARREIQIQTKPINLLQRTDSTRLPKHGVSCRPRGRRDRGRPGNGGNVSVPEQVKRPDARRNMVIIIIIIIIVRVVK